MPESSLGTLVKRGLVVIEEVKREFWMGGLTGESGDAPAHLSDDEAVAKMRHPDSRLVTDSRRRRMRMNML